MNSISLLSYFVWHYSVAIRDIFRVWTNFLWFTFNYFSISELSRTLIQPWKKLRGGYPRYFDIEEWISTFVTNSFMRVVGFIIRSIAITIGLIFLLVVFWVGVSFFVFWVVAPFVAIILIFQGFVSIF